MASSPLPPESDWIRKLEDNHTECCLEATCDKTSVSTCLFGRAMLLGFWLGADYGSQKIVDEITRHFEKGIRNVKQS